MAGKRDIPALTGLRGAAALWVAIYHLLLPARFVTGFAATILGRGYLAVDLFFILSGFVMALSYGHKFKPAHARLETPSAAFADFMLRRLARLYPLYGAILALRFAYTFIRYGGFDLPRPWIAAPMADPAWSIPANLLMVQSWGLAPSSIGTAWSISVEWGVYFLFPALAASVLWRSRASAAAIGACAAALIASVALLDQVGGYHEGLLDAWDGQTAGPMMRCIGGFILGMLLWRVSRHARIASLAGSPWCLGISAGLLAVCLGAGAPDLVIYPLFPALVLGLACAPGRTALGGTFPVWLGDISYALYLLHIFMLHPLDVMRAAAAASLPAWAADICAPALIFAGLLVASQWCTRCIERPGRQAIMFWGSKLLQARQAGARMGNLTTNT